MTYSKRTPLTITLVIILSAIIFTGCSGSNKYPIQPKSDLKGRFVFYSLRNLKDFWSGYILKDQKIMLLEKNIGCARWSPDGKYIAYGHSGGLVIYNYMSKHKEKIKTASKVEQLSWTYDNENIVYATTEGGYKKEHTQLWAYDLKNKEHKLIKDFEIPTFILELSISKYNKILFYESWQESIFIIDIDGSSLSVVQKYAMDSSWSPDGKHIGFFTNTADDGTRINDKCGAYFKMNIETGEKTQVCELTRGDWHRKISPDGKYLYYSRSYGKNGRYIAASPVDKPDVEIPITKPIMLNSVTYSQDLYPDWYQGE